MNYKAYMRSDEWKALREKKLEACQHKCECEGGCYREATQIHHLHYETLGDESFEDLQALCAKCHMKKSNVRGFYGNVVMDCCQHLPDTEQPEKILPYHVWHEANFRLQMDGLKCQVIARKLGAEPIIAALLDNLGILFACGDIAVEDKVTAAISQFADVVPAEEAGLKGYCDVAYKIKPEFEKCFEVSEEELETARDAAEAERADEEARMAEMLNQILSQADNEE